MNKSINLRGFVTKLALLILVALITAFVAEFVQRLLFGKADYRVTAIATLAASLGLTQHLSRN